MHADRLPSPPPELGPLVGPRWPIRCGHSFTPAELAHLRAGLWPNGVDDRWAVWLDGDILRCWAVGTHTCIYETQLKLAEDGSGVAVILDVLDDPEAHRRANTDTGELERFEGVLSLVWRRQGQYDAPPP